MNTEQISYIYLSLLELIEFISEPNRSICFHVLQKYSERCTTAPGAGHNHQWWEGGWWDHTEEGMNIMLVMHKALQSIRPLPFTLSDALLVFFLHDIEKLWRYERQSFGRFTINEELKSKESRKAFRAQFIQEEKFQLNEVHENALLYVESEGDGYKPDERVMGPLAAFCHMADLASARIWFDKPTHAERVRTLLTLPQD